ncbi:sugar kinase [Paenibacillus sp. FA6]|uniref:sugar kinase n=1 Tax=Paenibacillus sp. FA6 TaxID=3413029 RepID=UPI003F65DF5E
MPKRIAAFGEVMMRLQVPGYESLSQSNTLQYSFSGSGVNVASALARFGHTGDLVSTLPDNPIGEAAMAHLRKLGISTSFISRGGKYVGMYFLENGFGARPSRVTYSDRLESSFNKANSDVYDFCKVAQEIDIVYFCGITLAMNESVRQQMIDLAQEVKRNGGTVVFDCNFRPSLWGTDGYTMAKPHYEKMLHLSDIVMMNEKDAMFTLGMATEESERLGQLMQLIPQVAEKYDIAVIAGTHRKINGDNTHSLKGFMYKEREFEFSKELTFSVYDRIGAGDAYASGIIHGEVGGFTPKQSIAYATTAAMLAHTVVGDTPTSTEAEVLQAMTEIRLDVGR